MPHDQIGQGLAIVEDVLGRDTVGVHLCGSAVTGGLRRRGRLDWGVATIEGRMTSKFRGGEIYGIPITTLFDENDAIRCAGCGELIAGIPFRVTLLDIVSPEAPPSWAENAPLNPGPHQFHAQPDHFRAWARRRGYLFCRLSDVREIMRPVPIPGDEPRWGVCDGLHREAHEFVPA